MKMAEPSYPQVKQMMSELVSLKDDLLTVKDEVGRCLDRLETLVLNIGETSSSHPIPPDVSKCARRFTALEEKVEKYDDDFKTMLQIFNERDAGLPDSRSSTGIVKNHQRVNNETSQVVDSKQTKNKGIIDINESADDDLPSTRPCLSRKFRRTISDKKETSRDNEEASNTTVIKTMDENGRKVDEVKMLADASINKLEDGIVEVALEVKGDKAKKVKNAMSLNKKTRNAEKSCTLKISRSDARIIIGKKGGKISEIQESTNTHIDVDEGDEGKYGGRIVTISGNQSGLDAAVVMIKEALEFGMIHKVHLSLQEHQAFIRSIGAHMGKINSSTGVLVDYHDGIVSFRGDDKESVEKAIILLEKLLQPQTLPVFREEIDALFWENCSIIKKVERNSGAYLYINKKLHVVEIRGDETSAGKALRMLCHELSSC